MSTVTFKIKGAHFAQKSDLEGLITPSTPDKSASASNHSIIIWHGAEENFTPTSLSGEVCDLVIWISNDFVSCQSASISGITVPIWRCSTVTLLRHFGQLHDHLQKQAKEHWIPTAWIKDLELLRVLEILIQGYQLTHLGSEALKTNRFSETSQAYLRARGGEMETPAWWIAGLGFGIAGTDGKTPDLGDIEVRKRLLTETLKPALKRETDLANVNLNAFYDFLEDNGRANFPKYIEGIRSGILKAMPR